MRPSVLTSCAATALAACVTSSSYRQLQPTPARGAVAPESVQVYYVVPSRPFDVVGLVTAEGSVIASDKKYERALQKKAAEAGADAIIITNDEVTTYGGTVVVTSSTTATVIPNQSYGVRAYAIVFRTP